MNRQPKILILTCLWKRHDIFEIFKLQYKKLQEKYNIELLVIGSEGNESKDLCKDFYYLKYKNQPLSNKWNAGIKEAKKYKWDYLLRIDSKDFISDLQPYLDAIKEGYNYIGFADHWLYNIYNDKIYYFQGYQDEERRGRSVGSGRMLSRQIINQMNWELWDEGLNKSLDYNFSEKIKEVEGLRMKVFYGKDINIINLGIYTDNNVSRLKLLEHQQINKGQVLSFYDKSISDKINSFQKDVCLVIIPSFNEYEEGKNIHYKHCIESVLLQTYRNIRIAIIDDCSEDDTFPVASSYTYSDPRIVMYRNYTNKGCYNSINTVLQNEENYDCFKIQGADDCMRYDRVEKQFINDGFLASQCQYRLEGKGEAVLGHSMLCYSRRVFEEIGYFDNTRFAGDTEYYLRFLKKYGHENLNQIKEILYLDGVGNKEGLTKKLYPLGGEERKEYCIKFEQEHILMQKSGNFYRDFIDKEKVYFALATIPDRIKALKDTIDSVVNNCNEVHVYCNEWQVIPDFLKNNYKIIYYQSQKEITGDLGDVGKFYGLQNKIGYCFTIDDDLIYPKDYVSKMIAGLKKYNSPVSLHGKIFGLPPIVSFHHGSILENFRCQDAVESDRSVHIIGSGCFVYHSDMIQYKISDFENKNMSDIYVSIFVHKKGMELWVLTHYNRYLKESEKVDYKKSIWSQNHYKDTIQTKLINDNYKYFNHNVEVVKENIIFVPEIINEIEPIYMKLTIGDDKIMTLVKLIVIKEMDGDQKFATKGDILRLEESTANVLIRKGLVKIYDENLKKELVEKAEETILQNALKEEKVEIETNIETKESIKKKAGRPKKI